MPLCDARRPGARPHTRSAVRRTRNWALVFSYFSPSCSVVMALSIDRLPEPATASLVSLTSSSDYVRESDVSHALPDFSIVRGAVVHWLCASTGHQFGRPSAPHRVKEKVGPTCM